jgi:outer membrane receptor for ferrienterochelin and colicin
MASAGLLLLTLVPAKVATAADAASTAGPDQLQEVVVTAEKREENIEKVPISVSVLTRDQMMQRNITDMADVAAVTPGVDFQNQGSTIALSIRGISSGISGYSTTGIYLDDVPVQIRLDNGIVREPTPRRWCSTSIASRSSRVRRARCSAPALRAARSASSRRSRA